MCSETEVERISVKLRGNILGIPFGVDVYFSCNARVSLNSMTAEFLPLFEAVSVYLAERPTIKFDFTDAANLLELPGVPRALEEFTCDLIGSLFVYPNRLTFGTQPSVDISKHKYPPPFGVMRIRVEKIGKLQDTHECFVG